jgi:hypothetical protein
LESTNGTDNAETELHEKAQALVDLFRDDFGVRDLFESLNERE